jgi:hypothetical protein
VSSSEVEAVRVGHHTAGELHSTVAALAGQSAVRFNQIDALCRTLLLLLKSPDLYEAPWLATAQVESILTIAAEASAASERAAEQFGIPINIPHQREAIAARAAFIRSLG